MKSFTDPIKELSGPPSTSLNGIKFKSPTVDSSNVKLPSSIPTNLNPSTASSKISKGFNSKSMISNIKNKADQLQNKVKGIGDGLKIKTNSLKDKLNDKFGGLGENWNPEKFDVGDISGNSKFTDPLTGKINDSKSLLNEKKNDIDDLKTNIDGNLQDKQNQLLKIKSDMPKPKVEIPTGERIRVIKIK